MKRLLTAMAVAALVASAALAQAKSQTAGGDAAYSQALAEARRAIDKGNAQWVEGWEKGDPAMVAAIFTEDGIILAGNGKIIKGRQQILESQREAMRNVGQGVKVSVTTLGVWLEGDTAYETGKFVYRYKGNRDNPVTDEGRYVTIWKRQGDGTWKLTMDMIVPQD